MYPHVLLFQGSVDNHVAALIRARDMSGGDIDHEAERRIGREDYTHVITSKPLVTSKGDQNDLAADSTVLIKYEFLCW